MTRTDKLKKAHVALTVTSVVLNLGPILLYTVVALVNGSAVHQKAALAATILATIMMTVVAWINKIALRSKTLVILIGLHVVLGHVIDVIVVLAACQVLDEMVVTPLRKSVGDKLTVNRELDRRGL